MQRQGEETMTDGELYKRLPPEDAYGYELGARNEGWIVWENPKAVLDEAKADFPWLKTESYPDTGDDEQEFERVKAWFAKYFGS